MVLLAFILVSAWSFVFLMAARYQLRGLPAPCDDVPPYVLWLADGEAVPPLDPPPVRIHFGAMPVEASIQVLRLGKGVRVSEDLPRRLAACGSSFVSVFVRPTGSAIRRAGERLVRDLASVARVTDPRSNVGYADPRCMWFHRSAFDRPGWGSNPLIKMARGQKLHGLHVAVRSAHIANATPLFAVEAEALSSSEIEERLFDFHCAEPLMKPLISTLLVFQNLGPCLLLLDRRTFWMGMLALGLATATRFITQLRENLGWTLVFVSPVVETVTGFKWLVDRRQPTLAPMSTIVEDAAQKLTSPQAVDSPRWLAKSNLLGMAARLGGSAMVMESIYTNRPAGVDALGRFMDRLALSSPASRAVRWRSLHVSRLIDERQPDMILSIPAGTGRDVGRVKATNCVLVDPDQFALQLAQRRLPLATIVCGTLEEVPSGPYDLIVFVGLAEYLSELEVIRHLDRLRAVLTTDGRLLVSTTLEHPQRAFMSETLGWHTRARTGDDIERLLDTVGLIVESRNHDPNGIQCVLVARRRA
ncbi:MAG: hypothetical protein VX589_09985 [Myxococcota bacterium]|nr:hypothetical protein [Myxococcota bacterium]